MKKAFFFFYRRLDVLYVGSDDLKSYKLIDTFHFGNTGRENTTNILSEGVNFFGLFVNHCFFSTCCYSFDFVICQNTY